jgi:hypothetical protein
MFADLPVWGIVPFGAIALFSFLAVASWADARRREREAYYRSETIKKIAETQGADAAMSLMREDKSTARRRELEGIRLGGMVTSGVGVGLMIFLHETARGEPAYLVGLIPLLIGVALLAHCYMVKN